MKRKMLMLLLISLMALTPICGNVAYSEEGTPKYGGTFVAANVGDPRTLNTVLTTSSLDMHPAQNVFNCLIDIDENLEPTPELAQSWEWSPDHLTLTLNLVRNATWHDGMPFTSADVKFWWDEAYQHNPAEKLTGLIKSVETPDNYTVTMTLNTLYPLERELYMRSGATIIPKHLYEGTDIPNNPYNMKPIGTGPFMFEEYVPGDRVVLVRNPNYWKAGLPYLDKLIFKIVPDPDARVLALKTGEVDYLMAWGGLPEKNYQELKAFPGITASSPSHEGSGNFEYLFMNPNFAPFADKTVREAMCYAIDRETILERANYGIGRVMTGPWPSHIPGYPDDLSPIYTYNKSKADELLDAAGWPKDLDGIRFSVRLVSDSTQAAWTAGSEIIKENLRDVGIDVTIILLTRTAWIDTLWVKTDFELGFTYGSTGPDPLIQARYTYHGNYSTADTRTVFGNIFYNNPDVNALWDEHIFNPNEGERLAGMEQIARLIQADVPRVWLVENTGQVAFNSHFHDVSRLDLPFGGRRRWDTIWWDLGYDASPEEAASAIEEAQTTISSLRAQLYDTAQAEIWLGEAEQAYADGDYPEAIRLAGLAIGTIVPPYWLYGAIAVLVIAIVAVGFFYWRRKRK